MLPSLGRQRWYGDTSQDHRQAVGGSTGLAKRCRRLFAAVNLLFGHRSQAVDALAIARGDCHQVGGRAFRPAATPSLRGGRRAGGQLIARDGPGLGGSTELSNDLRAGIDLCQPQAEPRIVILGTQPAGSPGHLGPMQSESRIIRVLGLGAGIKSPKG